MKSTSKIWATLIVIAIIAIGGYFFPNVLNLGAGGDINTTLVKFAGGLNAGRGQQLKIDNQGNITQSPDGFVLWDDFTIGTTSPVRGAVVNTTGLPLMCDADSLYVYTDATTDFAPSFKFTVGTSTTAVTSLPTSVGYSANIVASTTVATTTDTVTSIGSGWTFLLPVNNSVTLAVGDYSSAIASSTYYSAWSGQFGVHCWTLGQ